MTKFQTSQPMQQFTVNVAPGGQIVVHSLTDLEGVPLDFALNVDQAQATLVFTRSSPFRIEYTVLRADEESPRMDFSEVKPGIRDRVRRIFGREVRKVVIDLEDGVSEEEARQAAQVMVTQREEKRAGEPF